MSTGWRSDRAHALLVASALGAVLWLAPAATMARDEADKIDVILDQAKLVQLPERVATVVVGNPLIADISLQVGGMMVVTGKGYGTTNVIAMDREGKVLIDRVVQVDAPNDKLVTVYRGAERESYSCTPVCQRRIMLGDDKTYFDATLGQAGSFAGQATGNAVAAAATAQGGAGR